MTKLFLNFISHPVTSETPCNINSNWPFCGSDYCITSNAVLFIFATWGENNVHNSRKEGG